MRKRLVLAVLIAALAPLLWLGASNLRNTQDSVLGMGQKLAGGWLATIDVGYSVEILFTLAADGGVIFNSSLRWAGPDGTGQNGWLNTRYNTTGHGTWWRTGPCQIEMLALLFIQDNDGNPVMYEKGLFQMTFKDGYAKLEGMGTIWLINVGNDPLDPNAPVFLEIPVPSIAGRPIR